MTEFIAIFSDIAGLLSACAFARQAMIVQRDKSNISSIRKTISSTPDADLREDLENVKKIAEDTLDGHEMRAEKWGERGSFLLILAFSLKLLDYFI